MASCLVLTHKSSPMQRSAILLIKGIDVGSFSEEEVHHLTQTGGDGIWSVLFTLCLGDGLSKMCSKCVFTAHFQANCTVTTERWIPSSRTPIIYVTDTSCLTGKLVSLCTTSVWPLKAAWCSAVRPPRSETLTLLSSGMIISAQCSALLAAATCSGVCQFLSRAFTSAEWRMRTRNASWVATWKECVFKVCYNKLMSHD